MPNMTPTLLDIMLTPALALSLGTLSFFDLKHHRLPDALTLPLGLVGLCLSAWRVDGIPLDALIGSIAGFVVFAFIGEVYFRLRGLEGLGLGDAKLVAAAGAWLGWQSLPALVLLASLAGLIMAYARAADAGDPLPFGPALCGAFLVLWLTFVLTSSASVF